MDSRALAPLEHLTLETAAEHVCTNVPIARPTASAAEVRQSLLGASFDSATHIAVCEHAALVGILRMEDLLRAAPEARVSSLMDRDPPFIAPGVDQEIAAWQAVQHEESTLAVLDADRHFLGFIPPHRLLAILLWEHEEDIARLGGFLRNTAAARTASLEGVPRRFWHRLPWLLAGLAGALFAADIVGAFEGQLQDEVILAFFIPGIVYLADAVGTQTETLVVRGLSVGVSVREMIRREVLTGILVGTALSLAFFPLVLWRWKAQEVALAVSLSLLAACSVATIIAMALPWAFDRLGKDPAFGSGPLATVLQDLLSILIYLAIATAIL